MRKKQKNQSRKLMKPQKSKLLIISIPITIILLGFAVYEYGFLRLEEEKSGMKEMISAKEKTLKKSLELVSHKPQWEKEITSLKDTRKASDAKIVEGQTPALASAALQSAVKAIIAGKGGTISSERVEKHESLGKFKIVSVSVDALIPDIRALNDILFAMETQTPYLVVKEIDARVRNFKEPRELMVKLKVTALTGGK